MSTTAVISPFIDTKQIFPLQTPEQSYKTSLFLSLVADTYDTFSSVLVVEQHKLKRDTYKRATDPKTGKRPLVLDENGEKIITGRKGIDWSKPSVFEVASGDELTYSHYFAYPHKLKRKSGDKWVKEPRSSIFETLALLANAEKKFLFYPCLVNKKPIIKAEYDANGKVKYIPNNYKTADVTYARCVCVDIDGHGSGLNPEQQKQLTAAAVENLLELLPSFCNGTGMPIPAVVVSGRGVHLYWWLTKAVPLLTDEAKAEFKTVLVAATRWASGLLERDSVCAAAWETDTSTAAVFHQMNLPGTVNPTTGTARYVANTYNVDYFKSDFQTIFDALRPFALPATKTVKKRTKKASAPVAVKKISTKKELPTEKAIPVSVKTETGEKVSMAIPSAYAQTAYTTGRLSRLLAWAASRGWDIKNSQSSSGSGREVFLFVCGALMVQQGLSALESLWDINERLIVPIEDSRVQNIIDELTKKAENGTAAQEKYYCYSNLGIAEALDMTAEEMKIFGFCDVSESSGYGLPSKTTFPAKLAEIKGQTPKKPEESMTEWAERCYELTCNYFKENRKGSGHAARTRRRAAQAGYTGKAGRKKKDPAQVEEERQMCIKLKQGNPTLTVREIAALLGFSKSKVATYLHGL